MSNRIPLRSALIKGRARQGKSEESIDEARDYVVRTLETQGGNKFQFCFSKAAAESDEQTFRVPMIRSSVRRAVLLREFAASGYTVKMRIGTDDYDVLHPDVVHWESVAVDGLDTFIIEL